MSYIYILGSESKTWQHELIIKLLDFYGVDGTKDLTDEQIEYFAKHHGDADIKVYAPKRKDGDGK